MKTRCNWDKYEHYENYGGRGITYCDRWEKFENFLSDMGCRPDGMTLDRINIDGNYEPSNCRWATPSSQRLNQRPRKRIDQFTDKDIMKEYNRRFTEPELNDLIDGFLPKVIYPNLEESLWQHQ